MVAALADFFFIAGLDGFEPAILHPPTTATNSTVTATTVSRADSITTNSPTKETLAQETIPEETPVHSLTTTSIVPDSRPATSSTIGTKSFPPSPPSAPAPAPPAVEITATTESETESHAFEQVIAKFTSEREDFLSTLAPPSLPRSPIRNSVFLEDEEEDELSELGAIRSPSPLRPRSSLRNKIADISRKASRTGTLKRRSTISTSFHLFKGNLIAVSRSSKRSSGMYNAVIPTPEPLVLPPGTHPLKRKLAPRLLGIWPTSNMPEEIRERGNPPDYLPMFAFPNDIQVRLSDDRPRSTWHGFVSLPSLVNRTHNTIGNDKSKR